MTTPSNPKYDDVDLASFDAEYAGQEVHVLVNPSRAFRASYNLACANAVVGIDDNDFVAWLSVILGMPPEAASEYVNNLPADAAQWLFFFTVDDFDGKSFKTTIKPYLYHVWDDWVIARVKARAARGEESNRSETMPSAAADEPSEASESAR